MESSLSDSDSVFLHRQTALRIEGVGYIGATAHDMAALRRVWRSVPRRNQALSSMYSETVRDNVGLTRLVEGKGSPHFGRSSCPLVDVLRTLGDQHVRGRLLFNFPVLYGQDHQPPVALFGRGEFRSLLDVPFWLTWSSRCRELFEMEGG